MRIYPAMNEQPPIFVGASRMSAHALCQTSHASHWPKRTTMFTCDDLSDLTARFSYRICELQHNSMAQSTLEWFRLQYNCFVNVFLTHVHVYAAFRLISCQIQLFILKSEINHLIILIFLDQFFRRRDRLARLEIQLINSI